MARMIAEVYDALRSAGADEEKARAAVAGQYDLEGRLDRVEGRLGKLETEENGWSGPTSL